MGILGYFYSATSTKVELSNGESHLSTESTSVVVVAPSDITEPAVAPLPSLPAAPAILSPPTTKSVEKRVSIVVPSRPAATTEASEPVARGNSSREQISEEHPTDAQSKTKGRRFSFKALSFSRKQPVEHKPVLSEIHDHEKREHASQASAKRAQKVQQLSRSDRRAKKSALQVRAIIVGPTSAASPKLTSETAKPQLSKLKTQLMQPKTANQVILHLRQLPANGDSHEDQSHKGPIHAVCLEHSDEEEHNLHFSKLAATDVPRDASSQAFDFPGVVSAPIEAITSAFNEMKLVDLVNTSDFGLGQPGDGKGILAGAVPTAETVIDGIKQITPELMALGYATGKAVTPDHSGMHPPADRMSILTYWWGLELLLPPPSIAYLSKAQSVSGALMNFLSAVALVNNGVREILPFIRYIAQFVDFEFAAIKKQDRGNGVVCAATWIMPAALVPRPWDFPPALNAPLQGNETDEAKIPADQPSVPSVIIVPQQPRPLNSIIDTVANPPTA